LHPATDTAGVFFCAIPNRDWNPDSNPNDLLVAGRPPDSAAPEEPMLDDGLAPPLLGPHHGAGRDAEAGGSPATPEGEGDCGTTPPDPTPDASPAPPAPGPDQGPGRAAGAAHPPLGRPLALRGAPCCPPQPHHQPPLRPAAPPPPGLADGPGRSTEARGVAPPLPGPVQGPGQAAEAAGSPISSESNFLVCNFSIYGACARAPKVSPLGAAAPPLPGPAEGPGQAAEAPGTAQPLPGPEHGPGLAEEAPVSPHTRRGPIASSAASEYFWHKGAPKLAHPPHPPIAAPRTSSRPWPHGPSGPRPRALTGPTGEGSSPHGPRVRARGPSPRQAAPRTSRTPSSVVSSAVP